MLEHVALIVGLVVTISAAEQFLLILEVLILLGLKQCGYLGNVQVVQVKFVHVAVSDRVGFLMLSL